MMEALKKTELNNLEEFVRNEILYCLQRNGYCGDVFLTLSESAVLTETELEQYRKIFEELKKPELWIEIHRFALENQVTDIVIFEQTLNQMLKGFEQQADAPHVITDISLCFIRLCVSEEEKKNIEKSVMQKYAKEWSNLLNKLQISENDIIVDDVIWETNFRTQMDEVIARVTGICQQLDKSRYLEIEEEVSRRFNGLHEEAKKFLASAEQMYCCFEHNKVIDFAPIAVEYSKAVESAFWNSDRMLESSYGRNMAQVHGHKKTMGAIKEIVDHMLGPLFDLKGTIYRFWEIRNTSAHINKNREPDVVWMRNAIWAKNGILDCILSGE